MAELFSAVTEADPDAISASHLPAVFANKFSITLTNNGLVRISFGETLIPGAATQFRGAFLCAVADVVSLSAVLQTIVNEAKSEPESEKKS